LNLFRRLRSWARSLKRDVVALYLAARDPRVPGTLTWIVEQGFEMGRPSLLEIEVDKSRGETTSVRVGGKSVMVCEGEMRIPQD